LITQLIGAQGDITKISTGLLIASDHAVFIGVMTNAVLGLLMYAAERRGAAPSALAQVVFWGVNIGLVGFLVGLIGEVTILKQVFTPIMGTALLIAIVAFILALRSSEPEPMAAPA
jgi:predicted membrane protein